MGSVGGADGRALQLKRIYSVRELARSQAFPDDFRFYTVGEDGDGDDVDVVSVGFFRVAGLLGG